MKIDLPETLPLHISTQVSHAYEQAMENREGSHGAMTKAYACLRDLLHADMWLRERVAAAAVDSHARTAVVAGRVVKKRGTRS